MFVKKKLLICTVFLLILAAGLIALHGRLALAQNPVLYMGSAGDDVWRVQQRLSQWGFYNGSLDGFYGYETMLAVSYFQESNSINADGVVGQATWAALGLSDPSGGAAVSRGGATDRDEVTLLARVIEGEAANESLLGKVAVGAVVLNRTQNASFPRSISGVIFQPEAFESIENGQAYRPLTEESVQAAQMAMSGYDPSGGALFFWNPNKSVNPWVWKRNIITQIGNHVFAR